MQSSQTESNIVQMTHTDSPDRVRIRVGERTFIARFEDKQAPRTCALLRLMLPLRSSLVHCRWSGESMWVPFNPPLLPISYENHTSHPAPGQILVYAQEFSEPEILMPYGSCLFSSKVGQLAGNHVLTVVEGTPQLPELGKEVLWQGAQNVAFELLL